MIIFQLQELKEKLVDSNDKTKSSEKRAKELEQMLNVSHFALYTIDTQFKTLIYNHNTVMC